MSSARLLRTISVVAVLAVIAVPAVQSQTVLILEETVSGGAGSLEATSAINSGMNVDVVNDATWAGLTAGDFASYRALIMGDNFCSFATTAPIDAAEANTNVWAPAVTGNVIVIGTDPTFHSFQGGADLTQNGIDFAIDDVDNTGAYITLSCYYDIAAAFTPVPLLDGFENAGFTATGVPGCFNDAHIVASHPVVDTLSDATLSNWGCSVHEAFDTWPDTGLNPFLVLAIAENAGAAFTAPDGSVGTPYIIARGEELTVISDISLTGGGLGLPVDSECCLTATVLVDDVPAEGVSVHFEIIAGPQAGLTADLVTDRNGQATFCYIGAVAGVDTIVASFVDVTGTTQTSNQAVCEFVSECFIVVGNGNHDSGAFTPDYHTFYPDVGDLEDFVPVLMDDLAKFKLPSFSASTVSVAGSHPTAGQLDMQGVPEWIADDMHFTVEILMWNPVMAPQDPEQDSFTLHVYVLPNGKVRTKAVGTGTIDVWAETYTDAHGQNWVEFPFAIPGF